VFIFVLFLLSSFLPLIFSNFFFLLSFPLPWLLSFFPLVAFCFPLSSLFCALPYTPLLLFPHVFTSFLRILPYYFAHVSWHFTFWLHDSLFVFHVTISCLTSTYWMLKTLNLLFNGGRNIKQCFLILVFYLAKFWAILNHKLK
jgi:hypothetical protein